MARAFTPTETRHREILRELIREHDESAETVEALTQALKNTAAVAAIAELLPVEDDWQSACGIVEATANVLDTYEIERPDHYDEETDIR